MAPPRDPHDLSLFFELFVASQRVRQLLGVVMESADLRPDEYAVYSLLASEGPLSPSQMSRRLGMPFTTVLEFTRIIAQRGHSERLPNPDDGRSYLIRLTPGGLEAHDAVGPLFDRGMLPVLERMRSPLDLRVALRDIQDALDETLDDLDGPVRH